MKRNAVRKRSPNVCAVARQIVEHLFGKSPKTLKREHGGITNDVFEARVGHESFVIRMSNEPAKLDVFRKEQWAIAQARKHDVPTAEVLHVGNDVSSVAYMVARKVHGHSGTGLRDKAKLLTALGRYAAVINSIRTHDFGELFDWSENQLLRRKTLADYFRDELKVDERLEIFERSRILDQQKVTLLRRRFNEMARCKAKPSLNHGDLRLKNIVIDDNKCIAAILDWEHCTSNFAPYWEVSIALHDLTMDEKEMFLQGYGIDLRAFNEMSPWIKALNILNYSTAVSDAFEQKDKKQLLTLQVRLNGAFDLYSL